MVKREREAIMEKEAKKIPSPSLTDICIRKGD